MQVQGSDMTLCDWKITEAVETVGCMNFQNALVQIACLGTDLVSRRGFKSKEIYSTVKSNTSPAPFPPLLIHVHGMESSDQSVYPGVMRNNQGDCYLWVSPCDAS